MGMSIGNAVGYWPGQAEVQHVGRFGVMMCCQAWSQPANYIYSLAVRNVQIGSPIDDPDKYSPGR